MNEYGFDYLNYITSIPKNMDYTKPQKTYLSHSDKSHANLSQKFNINSMLNNQSNLNMMTNEQTLDPTQGWLRGNLFANLYDPYKNYKPMELNPQNERETLLYQVMQYKFALIELNLYLDTHPNDTEALNLYNKYLTIEKQMTNKYESMYGPLSLDSDYLGNNTWKWKNSPWPWEGV